MNFDWAEQESKLRERLISLFNDEQQKKVAALEEAELPVLRQLLLEELASLAEAGYLEIGTGPKRRAETISLIAGEDVLAKISGSLLLSVEASVRSFGGLIAGWGSEKLRGEVLGPTLSGQIIGAVAVTEPGRSEPIEPWQTKAAVDGAFYRLSGVKSFVTNGPIADWIAVAGTVDSRLAFFLVRPDAQGVTRSRRISTMGYRGLSVCALELNDVKVPATHVIGPFENDDALRYLSALQDLTLSAAALGVANRTLDAANAHARTHHRGKKPIYEHQEVRFKIADMFTLCQTSALLIYRAAWCYATLDPEADVLIHCAKVFAAESAEQIASLAVQILASRGYTAGNPVEQGYREAKLSALAGTTSELARMGIADVLLKRYAP